MAVCIIVSTMHGHTNIKKTKSFETHKMHEMFEGEWHFMQHETNQNNVMRDRRWLWPRYRRNRRRAKPTKLLATWPNHDSSEPITKVRSNGTKISDRESLKLQVSRCTNCETHWLTMASLKPPMKQNIDSCRKQKIILSHKWHSGKWEFAGVQRARVCILQILCICSVGPLPTPYHG